MKERQVGVELCFPTSPAPFQAGLGHSSHIKKGYGSLLILQGVHLKSIYSIPRLFFLDLKKKIPLKKIKSTAYECHSLTSG